MHRLKTQGVAKRAKPETEPAIKSADFADLARRVKVLEKPREASDDLDDIRRQTLAMIARTGSSHYWLGQNLYRYREALEWGCWYPILDEISRTVHISRRTLLEIVDRYEKVKDTPPEVLEAIIIAGINPAAPRKRDLLASVVGSWQAGVPAGQAVSRAIEQTKRHNAPPSTFPDSKLTKREKQRFEFRLAIRKFLSEIPENEKTEELRVTLGEEITEPFTVVPLHPFGRKREPESELGQVLV
jgi:hypothetical protein